MKSHGSVLSRLHNPSIVGIRGLEAKLSSLMTVYASTSTTSEHNSTQFGKSDRHLEIKFSSLSSAGYKVDDRCQGWELNTTRLALVEKRNADYRDYDPSVYSDHHHSVQTPLILFYRDPDNKMPSLVAEAFVMSITTCKEDTLRCEIDVIGNVPSKMLARHYAPYSFNLAHDPRAEIGLGDGKAIVVKYRAGSKLLNVSIEELDEGNFAVPVAHDMAKTIRLSSEISRLLRSVQ